MGMFESFSRLWKPDDRLWKPVTKIIEVVKGGIHDGVDMLLLRRNRRGRPYLQDRIRVGPNMVSAFITHADGSVTDLGLSHNLLTNIGRDLWSDYLGGKKFVQNGPATASSSTTLTGTGSTWTASNLGTPQLGLAGSRIYIPITGLTTQPVYGNIVSNTTSVVTVDKWWATATDGTSADTTGTTPASTSNFVIASASPASIRFMALTTDSGAASAADTVLATEITTSGGSRALATYAHTYGVATFTLQKAFSISGTLTAIHKMGLFCCLTTAGADPMVLEAVLNADATCVNGDTLTVTDTVTLSG